MISSSGSNITSCTEATDMVTRLKVRVWKLRRKSKTKRVKEYSRYMDGSTLPIRVKVQTRTQTAELDFATNNERLIGLSV